MTPELLAAVDTTWDPSDDSFCSTADKEPHVLLLTFDVEVDQDDFDSAFAAARTAIEELVVSIGMPNRVMPLTGYTEEAQWRETT